MKYNKAEATHLFELLAKRMGKTIGYTGWQLDNAPHYGGYTIVEHEVTGGTRQLFGGRLPCREFCNAIAFTLDVLDYRK